MLRWFSWLFRSQHASGGATRASQRPAWSSSISVSSMPILLCSPLTPETMSRSDPQHSTGSHPSPKLEPAGEGMVKPVVGAESSVPWPFPPPVGARVLTFWGDGNAKSERIILPGDGALRILPNGGRFELRVQREDGNFLAEVARLSKGALGLMAISQGGSYTLEIEATGEWGGTVLSGQ